MSTPSFFSKALIIGAGPIVWETRVLDLIAKSEFKGLIVVTDRMLYQCLLKRIIPQKFQMIAVCQENVDPGVLDEFKSFFESALVEKYCKGMEIIIACTVSTELHDFIESRGLCIRKVHRFGKVCQLSNVENISIKAAGNVGMFGHQVARELFNILDIGTIGMEFTPSIHDADKDFEWIVELEHSKSIIADEYFEDGLITKNLSGQGRFYGKGIKAMDLIDFL